MCDLGKIIEIFFRNFWIKRHPSRMNLQYLQSATAVRNPDLDLAIESATSAHRRIDSIRAVGCCDHDNLAP